MATIRLLPASADMPPTSEVTAEYTSLVPANRLAVSTRSNARNDIAYPSDNFVWSASASDDGTFTFYAMPQKGSGDERASSQWDGSLSSQVSGSGRYMQNAIFQYALHASMPTPMFGQLVNLYA
jgi:hypothetical protein